ncbi:MAG: ABC transporter substrate-binding protein [Alphaproteobacteria bacterium]|jgi:microcin C transport system substrate-binding protein|nr:ABC transporter substrate-binding protein [Alphaproteobacteria bacterium]
MSRHCFRPAAALLAVCLASLAPGPAASDHPAAMPPAPPAVPHHALAMHGDPLYPPGFDHFAYADPQAPKGGMLSRAVVGSFDSLNPFIVRGQVAAGVRPYHFASLLARSWDEPFTLYGYVAETVAVPPDRSSVTFTLNPQARFHDGTPITVDDVVFTMETLRAHGRPSFRRNYDRIAAVERPGPRSVRFVFDETADRETPMILGLMPILSRDDYAERPFDRTTLEPPLGSGPYRIAEVEPGRRISFARVRDWWAADLPVFRGQFNFDTLRFDYYRDRDIALEAFKTGAYNFRREGSAETWTTDYEGPDIDAGLITMLALPHGRPSGLHGFVFNTRRPIFADRRVRRALGLAFDFEWVNRTLLYGQYDRITGMFTNSPLAPTGPPEGAELAMLAPFRDSLPAAVFGPPYEPPETDGSGRNRAQLREARRLLAEAGWTVRDGVLVSAASGAPFAFEILLRDVSQERLALAFAGNLHRLGITPSIRTVDSAQYANRTDSFDFDMTIAFWNVTLSPGAEQDFYWGSRSAAIPGTRNLAGVQEPAVDALIDRLEDAADYETLRAAAAALDRVIMHGHYVIPLHYLDRDLIAYRGDLQRVTDYRALYGTVVEAWWQPAE